MALYTLSPDEAQVNYLNLKTKYFTKLHEKLLRGDVTQDYYDGELAKFASELDNPDNLLAQAGDFDFNNWAATIAKNGAQAAGKFVSDVASSASEGAVKGLGITGSIIAIILIGLFLKSKFK